MRKPDFINVDEGGERERWFFENDGKLHVLRDSLNEQAIMEENKALRSAGVGRSGAWYRPVMQLSLTQYEELCRLHPDFRPGGDPVARKKIILRLSVDPDWRGLFLGKP